ncbi:heterokaryon incompatibility protein-domain-containing protein, partial [Ilyonectria sp. MPI-CAGE-AT-0026]
MTLPKGSIRLLRLLPHSGENSRIECQLITCSLLDSSRTHPYEALSYVWGSEENEQSICIDGNEQSVRAKLHNALLYLRDCFVERILWIDAICINQEDDKERGLQVESMAKIYAKASRVIVWLGEAAHDSDLALKAICRTAEEQDTNSAINETNQQATLAILRLLEREWFQRIWLLTWSIQVLQEVAAARHVLIKCGLTEIDGYVFCSGLSALNLSYETRPHLLGLIPPIIYLIRGSIFRPRHERLETSRSGRFSLKIRPLSELVDMYHTREATDLRDKVYALLGMSSDDPYAKGLSANYKTSWKDAFQKLVKFSLSDQMSVGTWDDNEVAVIEGMGYVLGEVSSVERDMTRDARQHVNITWKNAPSHFDSKGKQRPHFTFEASAKSIQAGDVICRLQGALEPTIIRPCNGFSTVIMITVPTADDHRKWLGSITTFPNDLLLVWDWGESRGKSQGGEDYGYLVSSRGVPKCPKTECQCQDDLDKATRTWNFGLLLNGMGRYEEAEKNLRNAVEFYRTGAALRSMDKTSPGHGAWRKADKNKGAAIEVKDTKYGRTPLWHAAANGQEAVVQQLLDKGAAVDTRDTEGRTPLSHTAANGHKAIVQQLLNKGADVNERDTEDRTPLSYAAANGQKAVVQLLLDKGAAVTVKVK